MAKTKRMISAEVVESGAFTSLPPRVQCLYFHMQMYADDEGAVANVRLPMASCGATEKDLKALVDARFVRKAGRVHVIKHWHIMNYIRRDRYTRSAWQSDLDTLWIRKDGVYTDHAGAGAEAFLELVERRKEGAE